MTRRGIAVTILVLFTSAGSTALADEKKSLNAAAKHYTAGQMHYDAKRYDEAIAEWTKAHQFSAEPDLLFNLGQAHRLKGDCTQALRSYEAYLRAAPKADNVKVVEGLAEEMRQCATTKTAPPKEQRRPIEPKSLEPPVRRVAQHPEPQRVTSRRAGHTMKIMGAVVGGVGLSCIGVGVLLALDVGRKQDELDALAPSDRWDQDLYNARDSQRTLSILTISVGSAAVIGGAVLYYLGERGNGRADRRVRVVPTAGSTSASIAVVGRF